MQDVDEVYEKHKGLIRSLINSVIANNPSVVSEEDLHQVGAIALILALKSYDPEQGSLHGYIKRCVRNALLEEANSFNGVFTTDPRLRRQANLALKMKREEQDEKKIMTTLGIATKKTLRSLISLAEGGNAVDIANIDIQQDSFLTEGEVEQLLDDVGLSEMEREFIRLITDGRSTEEIQETMLISQSQFYMINALIKDKITAWGKEK